MKTIYIRGGDKNEPGVVVLKEHLENKGHRVVRSKQQDYDVIVCWGCSMRDPLVKNVPALNGEVNKYNKYQALKRFERSGIPIPETVLAGQVRHGLFPPKSGPWFGRNFSHKRGKDIKVFDTFSGVINDNSKEFYTQYFEHTAELRAWVYDGKVFAWYKKYYRNPGIDNYKNLEFRSEFLGDQPPNHHMNADAVKSVKALDMDFGAVDILYNDNRDEWKVLEVNSMPDISSMERVSGIRLANIIHGWAEGQ